jgi:hypothetical protein
MGIGNIWPGLKIAIVQENDKGPIAALSGNHSSVNGNDSLAVMAVMAAFFNPPPSGQMTLNQQQQDAL